MTPAGADGEGRWLQVLTAFLLLGCTSFGGPIAHIGYFRAAFVDRRQWLDGDRFAALLALCQVLPGPASSQLGMAIGHQRAGWAGALAAWIGFTLPSALLMIALAWSFSLLAGGAALIHGLKLAAVAVVAQAVWLMARQFASGLRSAMIAIGAALACLLLAGPLIQIAVILIGAGAGMFLLSPASRTGAPMGRSVAPTTGIVLIGLFLLLMIGLPLAAAAPDGPELRQIDAHFRAGALVFGGGHVVLPLLEHGVVAAGAVDRDQFLAAYGAAQALPGPLFAVAAYPGFLGEPGGVAGAALALVAIFLPGALLLFGTMPFWGRVIAHPVTGPALAGANAAVVGLLAAALWDPLIRTTVSGIGDVLIVALALFALLRWKTPPLLIVAACVTLSLPLHGN